MDQALRRAIRDGDRGRVRILLRRLGRRAVRRIITPWHQVGGAAPAEWPRSFTWFGRDVPMDYHRSYGDILPYSFTHWPGRAWSGSWCDGEYYTYGWLAD